MWYSAKQTIKIKEFTDTTVTIESPIINNDLGIPMTTYVAQIGTAPILTLLEQDKFDQILQKEFKFKSDIKDSITMELVSPKDFDANKPYYVTVVPKNQEWFPWTPSNEIQFKLADMIKTAKENPDKTAKENPDETAKENPDKTPNPTPLEKNDTDLCTASISYVQKGQAVTVSWSAISNRNMNLYIRHTTQREFSKIATVNITDEEYTFMASRDGTHFIKFEIIDDKRNPIGTECIQTMHLIPFKAEIPVAPTNGPELTILLIIMGVTTLGYFGVRSRKYSK